jgi:cardiolipin synthase
VQASEARLFYSTHCQKTHRRAKLKAGGMETFLLVLAILGVGIQLLLVVLALFEPGLPYRMVEPPAPPVDSEEFAHTMEVLSDTRAHSDTSIEVLANGEVFYEAELEAIRSAQSHISLEAYIFQRGEVARRFLAAMAERARAGVKVRMVLDSVGSLTTWRSTFRELLEAGGEVHWYMPLRWYNVARFNNRTHRELLIVDSEVGFLGGAGVADHWLRGHGRQRRWRDTMFRVRGSAVASLQAVFAENWLESSGELLAGPHYYKESKAAGNASALVISSLPSKGRGTRARMLFQMLIASASRSIHITTPYFLPDRGARKALCDAAGRRGVELKIIVPGVHSDHLLTRSSSRRLYGELLQHGAQIYEYHPAMIHTKSMVVDGLWSVVGSTNFDSRSFGLNDEVNLAACDEGLAARLEHDFQADLADSKRITYSEWRTRSPFERVHEWLGWLVERQE